MSRDESQTLAIPATPGNGAAVRAADLDDIHVYLNSADFDGEIGVEVSAAGSTFIEVATETFSGTAKGAVVAVAATAHSLRLVNKTDKSGTEPTAWLTARNVRAW
jgi:hypothetical protein